MSDDDASPASLLVSVFDEVLERCGEVESDEVMAAVRAEFDERRGRVFEDEPEWETRTRMFLEWFAIERRDPRRGATPVAAAWEVEADPRRRAALAAWGRSFRCLAEFVSLSGGAIEIVDLLGGAHIEIDERRGLPGVEVGDIAEVRVVAFEDRVRFGAAFLWHPPGIRRPLVAHVDAMRAAGSSRESILDFASSLKVRSLRYKHVPPVKVYESPQP